MEITLNTKWNEDVKIFTENIEESALAQVIELANSPLGENAHIRIMPDVHAGVGCVIGTTMQITDKVCPNLVGVDIGCGITLAKMGNSNDEVYFDFEEKWKELDIAIRKVVPSGKSHQGRETCKREWLESLCCWNSLSKNHQEIALRSIGTLGGGWAIAIASILVNSR